MIWASQGRKKIFCGITNQIETEDDLRLGRAEAAEIIARTTLPKVDAVVFDPLMGTGAYLAAALKLGRRVIGADYNEEKYDIARAKLLSQLKS